MKRSTFLGVALLATCGLMGLAGCQSMQKSTNAGMLNSKCPFSGEKCDPSVTCDYNGGKVGFCCAGCKGKWEAASADAKAKMLKAAK